MSTEKLPCLYSFRRCPYAMRARMALFYAGIRCELREVVLADKPSAMLALSPKGTVPVLQLADTYAGNEQVLEESLDIMFWALDKGDTQHWLTPQAGTMYGMMQLIEYNDSDFKHHLDRYKYPDRFSRAEAGSDANCHRAHASEFIAALEARLADGLFLFGKRAAFADVAIFPFIRQFVATDHQWFAQAPYPHVRRWLQHWLDSSLFQRVMRKYPPWQSGDAAIYLD
ncbi:MAG: glutathione S-transferase [Mariprofundaceae bacterium]|nr:glutathione S-transferase [Mariprofundaceae bacterium]